MNSTLQKLIERARSEFGSSIKSSKGSFFTVYKSSEPSIGVEVQFQKGPPSVIHVGIIFNAREREENESAAQRVRPYAESLFADGVITRVATPTDRNVQFFGVVSIDSGGLSDEQADWVMEIARASFRSLRAYENERNGLA